MGGNIQVFPSKKQVQVAFVIAISPTSLTRD